VNQYIYSSLIKLLRADSLPKRQDKYTLF